MRGVLADLRCVVLAVGNAPAIGLAFAKVLGNQWQRSGLAGALAFLAVFGASSLASAYCVARTCEDECRRTSRGCVSEGAALVHDSPCLTFAVARGGAAHLGLTDEEFHDLVARAFERWSVVDCGRGETPGFVAISAGIVDTVVPYYCSLDRDHNQNVWFIQTNWRHDEASLGRTTASSSTRTGLIYDADVELNAFKVLADAPNDLVDEAVLSIATHEAGHVLGLDHSDLVGAIMEKSYADETLVSRAITADDIDGICELFPPEGFPEQCPAPLVADAALSPAACAELENEDDAPVDDADLPKPTETCELAIARAPAAGGRWVLGVLLALLALGYRRVCSP